MKIGRGAAGLAMALFGASAASAEPSPGMATGPVQVAAAPGELGLVRRAEARTEVALAIPGTVVLDEPGFYGMVDGAVAVQGSYAISERLEVFGGLAALQFRYVQNATLTATNLTLGALFLGATWVAISAPEGRLDLAPFVRLELPTSLEYQNARPMAVEPGLSLRGVVVPSLRWYAGASMPVAWVFSSGGAHTRVSAAAVLGGEWAPWRWFALALELSGRFGPLDPLEQVAAGLALRFAAGRFGVELDGVVPFAGASRATLAAMLRGAYRFP